MATSVIVLILLTVVGTLALWGLNRLIDGDGLGHRPAPRSHEDELDPRPWAVLSLR